VLCNIWANFLLIPLQIKSKLLFESLDTSKGLPGVGIFLSAASNTHLKGFSDSDWAGCIDTKRSIIGYTVYIGDSLISWKSNKQGTVSRSSSEAEYQGLASATCELQWLTYLMEDFKIDFQHLVVLYYDNKSTLHIAANPIFHERKKHIEIDCHIV